jgi:hypothetical protein
LNIATPLSKGNEQLPKENHYSIFENMNKAGTELKKQRTVGQEARLDAGLIATETPEEVQNEPNMIGWNDLDEHK